jgi:hypothetical protein
MSFASRLKQAIDEREISQAELAARIGKGKSSVSQYLSGKNVPKLDVQNQIAEVLDCTVEWLNSEVPANDRTETGLKNISIEKAAKALGKSEQFLRVALQTGVASFGFAVRNKTKWSYHISPKKFAEYVNCTIRM